jgi:hypothetical protein
MVKLLWFRIARLRVVSCSSLREAGKLKLVKHRVRENIN